MCKVKYKQLCPGFELGLPSLFTISITTTPLEESKCLTTAVEQSKQDANGKISKDILHGLTSKRLNQREEISLKKSNTTSYECQSISNCNLKKI